MILTKASMTAGIGGLYVLLFGALILPAKLTAQPDSATNNAKEQEKKPELKKRKSGKDLLKEIREASEPILAEMAEKHDYRLEADQVIRRVAPPFPELRATYYKAGHPSQAKSIRTPANAMTFIWDGKHLKNWGMTFGSGYSIAGVVDNALKIKSQDVEGPEQLLGKSLEGDWVIRPEAPEEKLIEELQTILQKEFDMQVRLFFAKRVRTVYVASGKYEYTPVTREGVDPKENPKRPAIDEIEIYGKVLGANGAGGGTGEFKEFLQWVGRWIEMPLINEVEGPPAKQVSWNLNQRSPFTKAEYQEDHDPESVLKNVAAQTGLTFKKEYRAIRRLIVEPIE